LASLAGQLEQIRRVRNIAPTGHRIGVFGASKRGKSSLLNMLLGVDILPVHPNPTTAVEIEVCHRPHPSSDAFRVIDSDSGIPVTVSGVKQACDRLGQVAVRGRGQDARSRVRVTLEGNFSKSALLSERVARALVDTPGADGLIGADDDVLRAEGQRALAAMRELDAVLFCVRLDLLQHADDTRLFKTHCEALRPIVAATYLDQWSDGGDPAQCVADWLEVPVGRIVCIDTKASHGGSLCSRDAANRLSGLIKSEISNGQQTGEIVALALRQLDFVLHAEVLSRFDRGQWPAAAWDALKVKLTGVLPDAQFAESTDIMARIEARLERCKGH
jgi:hypothetical protein